MAADELAIELNHRMPWVNAEGGSWWLITGETPNGKASYEDCVAIAMPDWIMDENDPVLFQVVIPGDDRTRVIAASMVTRARRLVMVHADDPATAVDGIGQDYLDASRVDRGEAS